MGGDKRSQRRRAMVLKLLKESSIRHLTSQEQKLVSKYQKKLVKTSDVHDGAFGGGMNMMPNLAALTAGLALLRCMSRPDVHQPKSCLDDTNVQIEEVA